MRHPSASVIEIAIAPHPARVEWSVLRVVFARSIEHERRVARALAALIAPEAVDHDLVSAQPTTESAEADRVSLA